MQRKFVRENDRIDTVFKLLDVPTSQRAALIDEYKARSHAAFAEATWKTVRQAQKLFLRWCVEQGHRPEPPMSPSVIASYVDYLGGRLRPNTIRTRLWAISEFHRANFFPSPCHDRLVELAFMGVKRKFGAAVRQAPALCKQEVMTAISRLGSSRKDIRDRALLWLATDSWCRASELVELRVRDIIPQPDGTSLLFIARSKTDQFGRGAFAFLSAKGTKAVRDWVRAAELDAGDPILTSSVPGARVKAIDTATVSQIMKKRTNRTDVSSHSTRVGGVHDALRIGCDLSSIMVAGRWVSSEMPAHYGRMILAGQSAAAKVSEAWFETDRSRNAAVAGDP